MKQCVDADNLHRRLKKIIGQVQAIDRMVDEDVPCEDILSQINAAKSRPAQVRAGGAGRAYPALRARRHRARRRWTRPSSDFTKAVERFANMG